MTKLNLDSMDVMKRVEKLYGKDWIETDIPKYYRDYQAELEDRMVDDLRRDQFFENQNKKVD